MGQKVERTAYDRAAEKLVAQMIADTGLSLRSIASKSNGTLVHTRLHSIINGERGPIRLSEWLTICKICGKDPAQATQEVLDMATAPEPTSAAGEARARWIAAHPDLIDKAAKTGDTDAEQAAYEEMP